jgi:glycosyltransferase involved in cell wall biosynthesis
MGSLAPFVSIVIPVFNEERYIAECLNSVGNLNYPAERLEVILVDNGSTDRTLEIARNYPIRILVKEYVKVGAVRNYGVSHARGEIIVFLDSDCVVEPAWLEEGVKKLSDETKLVLGGQYLMRDNPSWLERYWVLSNSRTQVYQTTLVGGCIFIHKSMFESVNGFDESLNSGEDSDLTNRLRQQGVTVTIDPSLSVVHLGYPSDVSAFIKRQAWHSADYVSKLPGSLKDKIFLLSSIFLLGIMSSIFSLLISPDLLPLSLPFLLVPPALLSIKRVKRSKTRLKGIPDYLSVYCIDVFYLIGRSMGILRGIRSLFLAPAYKEARR